MKKTRVSLKVLTSLLVALLVMGVVALGSLAADSEGAFNNTYGQIVPTDETLEAPESYYWFSGDKATIYFMQISKGQQNACFAIEFFSDEGMTQSIKYFSQAFNANAGNTPFKVTLNLDTMRSGRYYGKCYTYVSTNNGNVIDTDSVSVFTMDIDRLTGRIVTLGGIANAAGGVDLTWTPIQTAQEYIVYRMDAANPQWTPIQSLPAGSYYFRDSTVQSGVYYTYTVRAYDGNYSSWFDESGLSISYISAPGLLSVQSYGEHGNAWPQWTAVSGADGYHIYRKGGTLSASDWEYVSTVYGEGTTNYVDTAAVKTSWSYTYTVVAFKGDSTSGYDQIGVDFSYMYAPYLTNCYSVNEGMCIEWDYSNAKTEFYSVFVMVNGYWQYLGQTTEKRFVDTSVYSGGTFTYTVVAHSSTNTSAYYNAGISGLFVGYPLLNELTFNENGEAIVSWQAVQGAGNYIVYRRTATNPNWEEIAWVGGDQLYYTDQVEKISGEYYNYTVRANINGVFGGFVAYGTGKTYLEKPVVTAQNSYKNGADGVLLNWNGVGGAQGYNVYKSAGDSQWVLLAGGIGDLTYFDTTAENGNSYFYAVEAVKDGTPSLRAEVSINAVGSPAVQGAYITDGGVQVVWNEVEGAQGYTVFRRGADEENWTSLGETTETAYTDASTEAKENYFYYTVTATANGTASGYGYGKANFTFAQNLKAVFDNSQTAPVINVSWANDGIWESAVLERTHNGETIVLYEFKKGVPAIYPDRDIVMGETYTYTVTAMAEGLLTRVMTVDCKYPHYPIEKVIISSLEAVHEETISFVRIAWAPVEFAQEYEIYRRPENGQWAFVGKVSADSQCLFEDKTADTEITYYYTVKGVADDRESLVEENGKSVALLTPVSAPIGVTVRENIYDGKICAVVGWDPVEKAEKYKVERRTEDGEWEVIGQVVAGADCMFIDKTLEQGTKYYYTVVSYADGRGEKRSLNEVEYRWHIDGEDIVEPGFTGVMEYEGVWYYFINGEIAKNSNTLVFHEGSWLYALNGEIRWNFTGLVSYNEDYYYVNEGRVDYTKTGFVLHNGENYYVEGGVVPKNRNGLIEYEGKLYFVENGMYSPYFAGLYYYNDQWVYIEDGTISTSANTLTLYNGTWYYIENGVINKEKTTLVEYNGGWFYVENGQINWNFTGLVLYDGAYFYVENGQINWNYSGLCLYNDVWCYVENGMLKPDARTLTNYYGEWYYVENGSVNWTSNTLVEYGGAWYYAVNGRVAWGYTGLVQYNGEWYYIENGALNGSINGLMFCDGLWFYFENGRINTSATTLVEYNGAWYYVENGQINWSSNTLVEFYGEKYYVVNGTIDWGFTDLFLVDGTWYYVTGGVVAKNYTGLVLYYGTWYYVENGVLNWNATTLTEYYGVWYYVENGQINWNSNTLVDFYGEKYYVVNGTINWGFTDLLLVNDTWYYVVGGVVADDYTGLVNYYGGWYYVVNGVLDWNVTTLTYYNGCWYYVENGQINWSSNTLVEYNGATYYTTNGTINWGFTDLLLVNDTWYYVVGGVVAGDYTGLVNYNGGWYYVESGVVNFAFSGLIELKSGKTAYVENGEVNQDFSGIVYLDEYGVYIENGYWVDYTGELELDDGTVVYVENGIVYY